MKKESNPTYKFLNKDNLDRFYTKSSVVDNLLNEITLEDYDVVVEPSAGTGSWSSKIDDCVAIDIAPEHPDIMKGNFLEDDFLFDEMKKENRILVIGNPPFGRIGNKAIKFINKAAEFADTVAFILPRSFRKESLQRKINKNFATDKNYKGAFCGINHDIANYYLKKINNFSFTKISNNEDYDYIIMTNRINGKIEDKITDVKSCFDLYKGKDILSVKRNGLILSTVR